MQHADTWPEAFQQPVHECQPGYAWRRPRIAQEARPICFSFLLAYAPADRPALAHQPEPAPVNRCCLLYMTLHMMKYKSFVVHVTAYVVAHVVTRGVERNVVHVVSACHCACSACRSTSGQGTLASGSSTSFPKPLQGGPCRCTFVRNCPKGDRKRATMFENRKI